MLAREITMSPAWLARQDRQMGVSAARAAPRPTSRAKTTRDKDSQQKRLASPEERQEDPPRPPHNDRPRPRLPAPHVELMLSDTSDDLPSPRALVNRPPRAPPRPDIHDLETRNWGIQRIIRQRNRSGAVEYLVEWESSELPATLIRTRQDGSQHVCYGVREWDVACTTEQVQAGSRNNDDCVLVVWKDSWVAEADLADAREMLDDFKRSQRANLDHRGSQTDDLGTDGTAIQQHRGQLDNVFRPERNRDYSPALRATINSRPEKSDRVQTLMRAEPIRQTVFRDSFVESGKTVNIDRASSRNATLAHDSGFEQPTPCGPCEAGHGPFRECVAGNNDVGSCTNCLFDETGPRCNFHNRRE